MTTSCQIDNVIYSVCSKPNCYLKQCYPHSHFNIKTVLPGTSHDKDKTLIRLSYIYYGNPYTGSMASLYWDHSQAPFSIQIHWNENVIILTKFPSLAVLEVVISTISSAAGDENLIKMKTLPFQCMLSYQYTMDALYVLRYKPSIWCMISFIISFQMMPWLMGMTGAHPTNDI